MLASLHLFTDYEDEVTVNVKGKGVEGSSGPKQNRVFIRKKSNANTNPGSSPPGEGRAILEHVCND
jgi:hypothetical protein